MNKNLKLALQSSGFVALFALAGISGIRAETEAKSKHESKDKQAKKSKNKKKDNHEARDKALAKWQEGPSSLQTAYDALKGDATAITPKSLKDIDAIADDDAHRLELFKVIKAETDSTPVSEEDKAIVKKEVLEMANYARVSKGQVLELLGEMDKRDSKYLDDDDIREIRHAMSEGSFGDHDDKKDKHGDKKDKHGGKKDKHGGKKDKHGGKKDKKQAQDPAPEGDADADAAE